MTVRVNFAFHAINTVGIAIFLIAASQFWIEPELADVPGANVGNAFGWIVVAAPIPPLFIIGDMIWITIKLIKADWINRVRYTSLGVAALLCWAAAYLFDNAHHGM